jgi:hypothetical protein
MVGTTAAAEAAAAEAAAAEAAAAEEEGAMEGVVAKATDAAVAAAAESTSLCVEKAKIKRSESTSESPMIYLVNVEKVSS